MVDFFRKRRFPLVWAVVGSAVLLTVAGLFYWSIAVAQSSGDPEGLDLTDTDGDLLSDQWEEHYFGNLNQNGSGDFDLDDVIDADEYALGSDPSLANPRTLGESGTVLIKQGDREHWHAVSLTGIYENPVVVAGPASFGQKSPLSIRVRNISSNGFEIQLGKWEYLGEGAHPKESVSYLVVEAGAHTLADGTIVEAGYAQVAGDVPTVLAYNSAFAQASRR